jgi:5-methylcytosine-specific restriction endonuclease McrA
MGNCLFSKKQNTYPIKISKKKNVCKKIKTNKLLSYKKKTIPKTLKRMVWDKYVGADIGKTKCMCCKHEDIRQIEFHCGHIIAEANGGQTNIDNLRPICAQCNLSMGKMNMNVFMKKYMANY